ncbi:MAG: TerB family tellurite resistance protein [Bacteroidales bacterium]|nr:TerB family tellurite resistance protein [Bacteroidales bacterium]
MGIGKWITGAIGWALGGPIGALLGYSLGALFENSSQQSGSFASNGYSEQRNSFMVSMLVLSAAVMKADGKVMRSELDFVKEFIRRNFGEGAVGQALKVLQELLQKDIDLPQVCAQIKTYMDISQRLQLLHYLIGIAQADSHVSSAELDMLKRIAMYLGISQQESESIFAMFGNKLEDAYKVLEVSPDASDEEIKKAYKKMALKHHPDRVESLGSDVKKAAEEKFKAVALAYETIKKERGFN